MGVNSLYKTLWRKLTASLVFAVALFFFSPQVLWAAGAAAGPKGDATAGKTLFQNYCASCHNPLTKLIGPPLQGVDAKVPGGMTEIYKWVHNSSAVLATGDKYFNDLFNEYGKVNMTHFPQ
ncbi:MAG: c-type cytochrome, partial [Chitinophagaceae bacterium]